MTAFTLCWAPIIEERRVDLKSSYPYWAVKNGLMHAFPPLQADASCEVAVIGGGISGALIANELSHHGHEVLVIDSAMSLGAARRRAPRSCSTRSTPTWSTA